MSNTKLSPSRAREQAAFRYRNALEHGDFETVAAVLKLAERDPVLWAMIDELSAADDGTPEHPATQPARPPRSDKYVTQVITIRDPAANGQTPKPDHSPEENEMLYTVFDSTVPEHPRTLYPFAVRFITLVAALFVVVLIGGLLIEMVSDPVDGYPALVSLQTEEPVSCAAATDDPQAESARLAEASADVLRTQRRDGAELAALLAICALRTSHSDAADTTLQQVLAQTEAISNFPGHARIFWNSSLSPDGQYLLMGDEPGVRLLDAATGDEVFLFETSQSRPPGRGIFSTNGALILTNTADGRAPQLWDAASLTKIADLPTSGMTLGLSPDGTVAAFGSDKAQVQVWDTTTATRLHTLDARSDYAAIAFSPDGTQLLTTGMYSPNVPIIVWDVETGAVVRQLTDHTDNVSQAVFSPDGRLILSGSADRTAKLWDAATGAVIHTLSEHSDQVVTVAFSPDGRYALLGGMDNLATLWDVESGALVRRFPNLPGDVFSVGFTPDGARLFVETTNATTSRIQFWPTSIEDTTALACATVTRDFTPEERAEYGLGDGPACPSA